ncbi:MAG: response regulator [Anaerolineales bacterium]|nr:response regulator [Anaerolineales bacterium]
MAKVLIVDDDPATVELLAMAVRLKQHEPVLAYNGIEAVRIVEASPPDIILLDLMMPVMDGLETLILIREKSSIDTLPVLLVTASPEQYLDQKVREAGGNGCLRKPVSMDVLGDAIARELARL